MPTLILKFKDNVISEYLLEKGKSLNIGRREDNNVIIDNLAVSGHHAKVDSVGDGFLLTDLQSKNGSFVNEQFVASHWLKHGDVITIGKHNLVFKYKEGEAKPATAGPEDMDQTMVMDTSSYKSMLAKSAPASAAPAAKPQEKEPIGVLSFVSGSEGEVEISKKLFKIGKASTNDIVVSGFMVGQVAATISKRPGGYFISYEGSGSKPKVNGNSVNESVQLKEFDVIEIGSVKMHFLIK
ncbi:MAG: FHA domain-containing protein [Proteobacteria bacterium]|nr:FHA domain-containing protein [Pseudomonadota bacterium]